MNNLSHRGRARSLLCRLDPHTGRGSSVNPKADDWEDLGNCEKRKRSNALTQAGVGKKKPTLDTASVVEWLLRWEEKTRKRVEQN